MRILVLPGDGIGPEITEATLAVLNAVDKKYSLGLQFDFEDMGFISLKKYGITIRDEVLSEIGRSHCRRHGRASGAGSNEIRSSQIPNDSSRTCINHG
jgi:isocitrate/isopropylmalate dehydrogenase